MSNPCPDKEQYAYRLSERLFEAFMVEALKNRPLQVALERGPGSEGDNFLSNVARGAVSAALAFCEAAEKAEGVTPPWVPNDRD